MIPAGCSLLTSDRKILLKGDRQIAQNPYIYGDRIHSPMPASNVKLCFKGGLPRLDINLFQWLCKTGLTQQT
jgi:hypothetical protein